MYIYEAGSGFSGASIKVSPGFDMNDVRDFTQVEG